jgi:hypothetical protein
MNIIRKTSPDPEFSENISNSNFQEQDQTCTTNENIEKTLNTFVSAVENLMNRKE